MTFAWCPPGSFEMGSKNDEASSEEQPVHRVTLTKGFYLLIHPVTQVQWTAVMGSNPSRFKGDDRPVENVSWDACQEFCSRLTVHMSAVGRMRIRLPSEAEWEYACRAGTQTEYAFGDAIKPTRANYATRSADGKFSTGETTAVGSFSPNPWGLFDMHGNVWEWCEDWLAPYAKGEHVNPLRLTAAIKNWRTVRGGSWQHISDFCRAACRDGRAQDGHGDDIGFRVCFSDLDAISKGTICLSGQAYDDAICHFNEAMRLNPNYADAFFNRGITHVENGELDNAIDDYSQAIRINPNYAKAHHNRAMAYAAKKDYDKAIEGYTEAIRLDPELASAFVSRGAVYDAMQDHDKAIGDYSEAIRLNPTYRVAHNNRGCAYAEKKEYDEAIHHFDEAIRLNARLVSAYVARGRAWQAKGQLDRANKDYAKAILLDPKDSTHAIECAIAFDLAATKQASRLSDTYYNRAVAWAERQEYAKAIADFGEAIQLEPGYVDAYIGRGDAWLKINEFDKAVADYGKAIRLATSQDAYAAIADRLMKTAEAMRATAAGEDSNPADEAPATGRPFDVLSPTTYSKAKAMFGMNMRLQAIKAARAATNRPATQDPESRISSTPTIAPPERPETAEDFIKAVYASLGRPDAASKAEPHGAADPLADRDGRPTQEVSSMLEGSHLVEASRESVSQPPPAAQTADSAASASSLSAMHATAGGTPAGRDTNRGVVNTPGPIDMPRSIFDEMLAHVRRELPNQGGGLIAGKIDARTGNASATLRATNWWPLINEAASPTEFLSEAGSLFRAVREVRRLGLEILAFYHSHPTTDALPSSADLKGHWCPCIMIISLHEEPPTVRAWWLAGDCYEEGMWSIDGEPHARPAARKTPVSSNDGEMPPPVVEKDNAGPWPTPPRAVQTAAAPPIGIEEQQSRPAAVHAPMVRPKFPLAADSHGSQGPPSARPSSWEKKVDVGCGAAGALYMIFWAIWGVGAVIAQSCGTSPAASMVAAAGLGAVGFFAVQSWKKKRAAWLQTPEGVAWTRRQEEPAARAKWNFYHGSRTMAEVGTMSGVEFEQFLATLFRKLGYADIQLTPANDQGGDLVCLSPEGARVVIQAKRYSGSVGNGAVQEVLGAMHNYDCALGMVVTNSRFTDPAYQLANKARIVLHDGGWLEQQIRAHMPDQIPEFTWEEYDKTLRNWHPAPVRTIPMRGPRRY
jgi:tetratricopeptide (TPR) repeat protein/proteasome lid subunit RPN8/RPN11